MREQILALIEPRVRELAELLADAITTRIAVLVGQLEFSFEAALSSFESDLARGDTYLGGEGADAAPKQTPLSTSTASSRPSGDSDRATAPARTDGVRGGGRLSPRSAVPEPAVAAEQGSTSSGRKPNSCRKCGAVGFTAATCGKTHNVSIVDAGERGSGDSAPHETQQGADTPGHRASEAAGNVADPHRTPSGHRSTGPAPTILSAIPKTPASRAKLSPAELEAAKARILAKRAAEALRDAPPPALAAA